MQRAHRHNLKRLKQYVKACEGFVGDLRDVLEDLHFQQSGGRLLLATDFSEVFAYTLPGEGATEMVHFDDPRAAEVGLAIEASALDAIFFGSFGPALLLAPYRVELSNFLQKLRTSNFEKTAVHLLSALSEVRELVEKPETQSIIELGENLQNGRELDPSQIDQAVRFFERYAPSLVLFATRGSNDPISRLRHLLGAGQVIPPEQEESLDGFAVPEDDELVREIFGQLESARRQGSSGANYVDAVALAHLTRMNRYLAKERIRVVLVTRSRTLARPLDQLGLSEVPLRHPRIWSTFFRPTLEDSWDQALGEVEERHSALQLFVQSAKEHLRGADDRSSATPSDTEIQETRQLIERIEHYVDEWLLGQRVMLSGHLHQHSPTRPLTEAAGAPETVGRLLRLISDNSQIFDEVRERLEGVARDHEYLGWYLHSGSPGNRKIIGSRLTLEGFEQKTVFSTTADSIQYTLQFSSKSLIKQMRGIKDRWWITFEELRELLKEGLAESDDYERLLVMAYTLGLLGRWPLAERYAQAAVEEAPSEDGLSRHEGFFFLAVCHRKSERSRERLQKGLEYVQTAIELKRRHLGNPSYEDPRFLKERATLLQVDRSLKRLNKTPETAEQKARAISVIETYLRAAAKLAVDDRYLRLQVYNGLCYLYLTEGEKYRGGMRYYRELLENELAPTPHVESWPGNCIDTLCWSRFTEDGRDAPVADLEEWATRLEEVIRRPLLVREDRQRVRRHRRRILDVLRKRKTPRDRT